MTPSGCVACGPVLETRAPLPGGNGVPQIATRRSGGSPRDEGLIAFRWLGNGGAREVRGQLFEAIGAGGGVVSIGGGCTANAPASIGAFALGNENFQFHTDTPLGAAAVWLNLNEPGLTPWTCGSCLITPFGVMIPVPISFNHASLTLAVPCDPSLLGASIEAQWGDAHRSLALLVGGLPSSPTGWWATVGL